MAEIVIPGEPPVAVTLRRSARARRLSLRISRLDGRVTLTLPARARESEARAFAFEKAGWIRRHLADMAAPALVELGTELPLAGRPLRIVRGLRSRIREEAGVIEVSPRAARVPAAVGALVKAEARSRLSEA